MTQPGLDHISAEIRAQKAMRPAGRIHALSAGLVEVTGLCDHARLGDLVWLPGENPGFGEVVTLSDHSLTVLCDSGLRGRALGDLVMHLGRTEISPDPSWIGRVIDPMGRALDNRPLLRGLSPRSLDATPPEAGSRRGFGARLETGLALFNTLLPIARGQRLGLFAGAGVGKSTLLAMLGQGVQADVIVVALVGERGRELRHFVENVLGPRGMARAVIVAATSDTSPLMRRRCGFAAMAVAEFFRDQGKQVLLLIDSITRMAEAHREIALATGEGASLRGFPPSLAHLIPQLCERAGPGVEGVGDITAVFSILVAASDMEEPVADILRGVLDGHVVLEREIAERGRFPAVNVLRSLSRALPAVASNEENLLISRARALMGAYARAEMMIQAGLYDAGSDPQIDAAILAWPRIEDFISRLEYDGIGASFQALDEAISGSELEQPES